MPADLSLTQQSGSLNTLPATNKRQKKKKSGVAHAKVAAQTEVQSSKNSSWQFAWFIFVWMLIFGYMATSSEGRLNQRDALGDAVMTLIIMMAAVAYYYGRKVATTLPLFRPQGEKSDLLKKVVNLQSCQQHHGDLVEASAVKAKEELDDSAVSPSVKRDVKSSHKVLNDDEVAEEAEPCGITCGGDGKADVVKKDMGVPMVTPLPLFPLRPRFHGGAAWADIDSDDEPCLLDIKNGSAFSKCDLLETDRADDTPSTSENGSLEGPARPDTPSTSDSVCERQSSNQDADVLQTEQDEGSGVSKNCDEQINVPLQTDQDECINTSNRAALQVNACPFVPGTMQNHTAPLVEFTSVPVLVPNAFDYGQVVPFNHQDLDAQQMFGMPIADAMSTPCMNDSWDYYGGFPETEASQTGHYVQHLNGAGNVCFHESQPSEFVPFMDVSSQVALEHNYRMNITAADLPVAVDRTINDFSDSDWEPNNYEAFDSDSDQEGSLPVTTAKWWSKTLSEKKGCRNMDQKRDLEVRAPPSQKPLKKIQRHNFDWEAQSRVVRSLNALDLIKPTSRRTALIST